MSSWWHNKKKGAQQPMEIIVDYLGFADRVSAFLENENSVTDFEQFLEEETVAA